MDKAREKFAEEKKRFKKSVERFIETKKINNACCFDSEDKVENAIRASYSEDLMKEYKNYIGIVGQTTDIMHGCFMLEKASLIYSDDYHNNIKELKEILPLL